LIWRRRERRRSSTDGKILGFNAFMRTAFSCCGRAQASATARLPSAKWLAGGDCGAAKGLAGIYLAFS
jgi:hypothetical protein